MNCVFYIIVITIFLTIINMVSIYLIFRKIIKTLTNFLSTIISKTQNILL